MYDSFESLQNKESQLCTHAICFYVQLYWMIILRPLRWKYSTWIKNGWWRRICPRHYRFGPRLAPGELLNLSYLNVQDIRTLSDVWSQHNAINLDANSAYILSDEKRTCWNCGTCHLPRLFSEIVLKPVSICTIQYNKVRLPSVITRFFSRPTSFSLQTCEHVANISKNKKDACWQNSAISDTPTKRWRKCTKQNRSKPKPFESFPRVLEF